MMPVSSLREEFAALVRDGARCGLGRGALEITRIAYPDLQPDRYLAEFDELAEAARPGTGVRTGGRRAGRWRTSLPRVRFSRQRRGLLRPAQQLPERCPGAPHGHPD